MRNGSKNKLEKQEKKMLKMLARSLVIIALACSCSLAQEYINHSTYQAVNADGSSAYSNTHPFNIRLVGVVLNNTEDWLNPAAAYDSEYNHPEDLFEMGGQAEFYIQAVNLDDTAYDPDPGVDFNDFGGTACWMGQNYGNHIKYKDAMYNYTDAVWYSELDRLKIKRPETPLDESEFVRVGDLVEVTVSFGLPYQGKMNVNENHSLDEAYNFSVTILHKNYGLPEATAIELEDLKTLIGENEDVAIFDPSRETGGERYQSTLVELQEVRFEDLTEWGGERTEEDDFGDFIVRDRDGRKFTVHLGQSLTFDGMEIPLAGEYYNLTGILDQSSSDDGTDGYQLLVMTSDGITMVPEPASLAIIGMMAAGVLARRKRK